jgi:hypothetical protein
MASVQARIKAAQTTDDQAELIALLSDVSPLVVEAAAKRFSDPKAATALLKAYMRLDADGPKNDSGCWGRMALLEALARTGEPVAETAAKRAVRTVQVEGLNYKITDTATGLRCAAAALLANLRSEGALIDLAVLLNDFEPNYGCSRQERPFAKLAPRVAAARAIGALGDPAGAAVLVVKLAFPGEELPEVIGECMDALVALREPRATEILEPWLSNGDAYLVSVAATGMARSGGASVIATLERAAGEVVADARAAVVYALASIRADETRAALNRLAAHEDDRVSNAAREYVID